MDEVPFFNEGNCSGSMNCSENNSSLLVFGEVCQAHPVMFFIMAIAYGVVALLAVIGNVALILIIMKQKEMHNVTNTLIANLSVSDLLMSVMCLPFTLVYTFMDHWVFGEVMCKLNNMVQCVSVSVSILSLVLIAVERHQLIINPRGWRPNNMHAYVGIAIIWVMAICISLPLMLFTNVTDDPLKLLPHFQEQYNGKVVCISNWPSETFKLTYTTCLLMIQYIGPLCFIFMCYLKIYIRLKRRNVMMDKMRENKCRSTETKRINVMLISIVVAFAVCWLPLNIFNAVADWNHEIIMNCSHNPVFLLCLLTAMISTCVNPIFYGFLNRNFQRDLHAVFRFCKFSSREEDYETIAMSTVHTDVSKTSLRLGSPEV